MAKYCNIMLFEKKIFPVCILCRNTFIHSSKIPSVVQNVWKKTFRSNCNLLERCVQIKKNK